MRIPKYKIGQTLRGRVHREQSGTVQRILDLGDEPVYELVFYIGEGGLMDETEVMERMMSEGKLPEGAILKDGILWASPKAVEENARQRDTRKKQAEGN